MYFIYLSTAKRRGRGRPRKTVKFSANKKEKSLSKKQSNCSTEVEEISERSLSSEEETSLNKHFKTYEVKLLVKVPFVHDEDSRSSVNDNDPENLLEELQVKVRRPRVRRKISNEVPSFKRTAHVSDLYVKPEPAVEEDSQQNENALHSRFPNIIGKYTGLSKKCTR